jgi:hypothetical protein
MAVRRLPVALSLVLLAVPAACDDDSAVRDPNCCQNIYPVWCARFAECDPLTFSLSWRDPAACSSEQVPACQAGHDAEDLCGARTPAQTDACVAALTAASCDDLFGSNPLPRACL